MADSEPLPTLMHVGTADTPELTVLGLFRRGEKNEDPGATMPAKTMIRRRMKTRPIGKSNSDHDDLSEEYETAMFIPKVGLTNSMFTHIYDVRDGVEYEYDPDDDYPMEDIDLLLGRYIYEERTILFQCYEHYEILAKDPHTSSLFNSLKTEQGDLSEDLVLQYPRFGEQIIVKGVDTTQLCVGDVFVFEDAIDPTRTGLIVEITSPRKGCSDLDKKNASVYGRNSLHRHVNTFGLGGFFTRVLQAGEVRDGMKLRRIAQPNPKWTLAYLSTALYGECDRRHMDLGLAQWNRSKEELEELCNLEQLGWDEWQEEAQSLLDNWDENQEKKLKDAQKNQMIVTTKIATLQAPSRAKNLTLASQSLMGYLKPKLVLLCTGALLSYQWGSMMPFINAVGAYIGGLDAGFNGSNTFFDANSTFNATDQTYLFGTILIGYQ